eukprot:6322610-Prymnesium_polylepis.1
MAKGSLVIDPDLQWASAWELIEARSVNLLTVVPAVLQLLYDASDAHPAAAVAAAAAAPRIRGLLVGGQSLSAAQLERAKRTFDGAAIVQTYA